MQEELENKGFTKKTFPMKLKCCGNSTVFQKESHTEPSEEFTFSVIYFYEYCPVCEKMWMPNESAWQDEVKHEDGI